MLSLEGPLVAEQKMEVGGECMDEERRLWVPFEGNIIKGLEEPNLESEERTELRYGRGQSSEPPLWRSTISSNVFSYAKLFPFAISPVTAATGKLTGTLCILNIASAEASQLSQSLSHSFGHFGFLLARTGVGSIDHSSID
ncbi:hypothetical protein WN944_004813 [Citrus x changshan-huyou]|uniref:Uncharacterized protein n=1 Tax=Citrus x changshan-huyou TaxID=2935761 RepID=A0AAP0M250_9ROSI